MPKELHDELREIAKKKFPGNKKRQDAYVYGTLNKLKKEQKKGKK